MPCVGFEPTIPAFERAKTVHALDRAAAVIGNAIYNAAAVITAMNNRKRKTDWGSLFTVPTVNIILDQQVTAKV
jgi:hypothetical protein